MERFGCWANTAGSGSGLDDDAGGKHPVAKLLVVILIGHGGRRFVSTGHLHFEIEGDVLFRPGVQLAVVQDQIIVPQFVVVALPLFYQRLQLPGRQTQTRRNTDQSDGVGQWLRRFIAQVNAEPNALPHPGPFPLQLRSQLHRTPILGWGQGGVEVRILCGGVSRKEGGVV